MNQLLSGIILQGCQAVMKLIHPFSSTRRAAVIKSTKEVRGSQSMIGWQPEIGDF